MFALLASGFSACGFWQKTETANPQPDAPTAEKPALEIPFSTVEPADFQAEIVSTNFAGGEKNESRIFIARSGAKLLTIFNFGAKTEISRLEIGNKVFLVGRAEKVYAESAPNQTGIAANDSIKDFLATEWLNEKTPVAFERRDAENNLTEYRVNSANAETVIFVDENLKIPVRQEFYDAQKTLLFSSEITNFKTSTDDKIFDLPRGFRKISTKEFQEILRRENLKTND